MDTDCNSEIIEHPTICRGSSFPPLEECTTCCVSGLYHCPFCPPECFKPAKRIKIMTHLESHKKAACYIGGYAIYKCALECRRKSHYHCLHCKATLLRRRDFVNHVSLCQESRKNKNQNQFKLPPFMLDDSDSDDSDLDDSREGSSSHFRNPAASGISRQGSPNSPKCNRMLPTQVEKPQDCDEFYFMNLSKIFKRLTPQKKTDVRLRIERILFEAEFQ